MLDPDALTLALRATHSTLDMLRLQGFTGALWVVWQGGVCVRVMSEGVSTFAPCTPPRWSNDHSRVLQWVRQAGVLEAGRVLVQLEGGRPVGVPLWSE